MKEGTVSLTKMLKVPDQGHIIYIYDDIQIYIDNIVSYIQLGIEAGQHIIIIDHQPTFELITHKLHELYTQVDLQRIHYVDHHKFYRLNRDFCCDSIINHFAKELNPLQDSHFSFRTWSHVERTEHDHIIPKRSSLDKGADKTIRSAGVMSVCA